jgi:putative inorganic carbon (hco3(-)) transporter
MKGLLFTYILTYGGAVISLFDPYVGLLIYVCFAIIKPESLWYWSVPAGNYSRIVAICLLAGWIIHGFGSWDFGRARAIVLALLFYWLWCFVGISIGSDPARSWRFFEEISKIVLPFLVGITTIGTLDRVKHLAWVIVLSEGYLAWEFNLSYYTGYNRLWEEGFGQMDNNCNAIALVTCFGLALFLGLHTKPWWGKLIALAAAALMGHAIFFSFSRGGMLALIVTLAVAFILIPKTAKHYLVFGLLLILLWRLAGPEIVKRFGTIFADAEHRDDSSESRLELWGACWQLMTERPFGIGPDHWPLVADQFGFRRGKEAHTVWLQVGAEQGFPGLIVLVSFFALSLVRLWPLTRRENMIGDPWVGHISRMVIAALIGYCVSAQFVSIKGLEHPYYIALLGACVLKLVSARRDTSLADNNRCRAGPSFQLEASS